MMAARGQHVVALPAARHSEHDTGHHVGAPAQWGEDNSIDDFDDLPDDDARRATVTGFGLYDAYEEADKW